MRLRMFQPTRHRFAFATMETSLFWKVSLLYARAPCGPKAASETCCVAFATWLGSWCTAVSRQSQLVRMQQLGLLQEAQAAKPQQVFARATEASQIQAIAADSSCHQKHAMTIPTAQHSPCFHDVACVHPISKDDAGIDRVQGSD